MLSSSLHHSGGWDISCTSNTMKLMWKLRNSQNLTQGRNLCPSLVSTSLLSVIGAINIVFNGWSWETSPSNNYLPFLWKKYVNKNFLWKINSLKKISVKKNFFFRKINFFDKKKPLFNSVTNKLFWDLFILNF